MTDPIVPGLHQEIAAGRIIFPDDQVSVTAPELTSETVLPLPPFPLPEIPGLRFLDTVGALYREGTAMRHCIAGYAHAAIGKSSYLFHYDCGEEMASVELGPDASVRQCFGPCNTVNNAAVLVRQLLHRWKQTLSTEEEAPAVELADVPF